MGLDRIDEEYIESMLGHYSFIANADNYHKLISNWSQEERLIVPTLSELRSRGIKIMLVPVAIDSENKQSVVCRTIQFDNFEDINLNTITHFYGIFRRMSEGKEYFVLRGILKEMIIGDVVYLNSGSPPLTVVSIIDGHIQVKWNETPVKLCIDTFPIECLSHTNNVNWNK